MAVLIPRKKPKFDLAFSFLASSSDGLPLGREDKADMMITHCRGEAELQPISGLGRSSVN
jgi:hypothetical protein